MTATTRPGSETTRRRVGDAVYTPTKARTGPTTPSNGRKLRRGWIAVISRQTFADGTTYVELGVSWIRPDAARNVSVDAWYRDDELVTP